MVQRDINNLNRCTPTNLTEVLPDSVRHNDRIVQGITNHRQQSGNYRKVKVPAENREHTRLVRINTLFQHSEKTLEAEFLRARFKDLNWAVEKEEISVDEIGTPSGIFFLNTNCLELDGYSKNWIYDVQMRYFSKKFGDYSEMPTIHLAGFLGRGNEDAIRDVVKETVEKGVTEYLKANVVKADNSP